MKEQYAGDVSDYKKYALLRKLSGEGEVSIGVCWMLTPPDGRTDGNKTKYLQQPEKHRDLDPELYDTLKEIVEHPDGRELRRIEESGILPSAKYFNDTLPDDLVGRAAYFERAMEALKDCDLIFFDPDNGLDVKSVKKGRKNSSKYIYRDEVAESYKRGHSVLIYQHFPRANRAKFIEDLERELKALTGATRIETHAGAHAAFLLIKQSL